MSVGFASRDDAQRLVDTVAVLSSMFLTPRAKGVPAAGPIVSMVRPKAGSAPAGYTLGEVVWFDPATATYVAAGGDVLVRWPAGSTPDTAGPPSLGQFAGTLDHSSTLYGVYVVAGGALPINTVDVPWSWSFDPDTCTLSVATVRTLTGSFSIGAEHAP